MGLFRDSAKEFDEHINDDEKKPIENRVTRITSIVEHYEKLLAYLDEIEVWIGKPENKYETSKVDQLRDELGWTLANKIQKTAKQ